MLAILGNIVCQWHKTRMRHGTKHNRGQRELLSICAFGCSQLYVLPSQNSHPNYLPKIGDIHKWPHHVIVTCVTITVQNFCSTPRKCGTIELWYWAIWVNHPRLWVVHRPHLKQWALRQSPKSGHLLAWNNPRHHCHREVLLSSPASYWSVLCQ